MESAKIFGSQEECPSCESGWTMYLVSPSHHHDDYYYDDHHHHHHHHHEDDEDHSDGDSMASDASSGPMEATSRLQLLNQTQDRSYDYGLCLTNKTGKPVMKTAAPKEDKVFSGTRVPKIVHDDDDDDDDNSSDVHSCAGSVKPEGFN